MNQKSLFLSVAGLIILASIMVVVIFKNHQPDQQGQSVSQKQGVLVRQGAPMKGPSDARVTIVEFLDPACGTCAEFYPFVKKLIDQYPGKVNAMFRYAPLHTGSDQVVKMLEAAHLQGKFFEALELLFNNQGRWIINHTSQPMRAMALLNSLDLDQDRLTADMNSPEVIAAIEKDVQDGQALNVRATPEFFVNGKPMPSFGYKQLSQLVEDAVADAY
jgi:protein-disulfide isomerase